MNRTGVGVTYNTLPLAETDLAGGRRLTLRLLMSYIYIYIWSTYS